MLSWACKCFVLFLRACLDSVSCKNNVLTSTTSTDERAELIHTLRGILVQKPDMDNRSPNLIFPPAGRAAKVHLKCSWSIFAGWDVSSGLGEGAWGLHSRLYLPVGGTVAWRQLLRYKCCKTALRAQICYMLSRWDLGLTICSGLSSCTLAD